MSVWLSALKLVPWDDVLKQTPKLVRQARGLFRSSKSEQAASASQELSPDALDGRDPKATAALVRTLHNRVLVLEKEQRDTAALIESLAEQQEMVVQTLGALRARAKLLTLVSAVLTIAVIGLLTWVSRH